MDRATKRALAQLDRDFTDRFYAAGVDCRGTRDVLFHATMATWGWRPCDNPKPEHPTTCGRCPNCVELKQAVAKRADAKFHRDRARLARDTIRREAAAARAAILAGQSVPAPLPEPSEPPLSERAREIQIMLAALREQYRTTESRIQELETEFLNEKYGRPAG